MEKKMSMQTRKELLLHIQKRYNEANCETDTVLVVNKKDHKNILFDC